MATPKKKTAPAVATGGETNPVLIEMLAAIRKHVEPKFPDQGKDEVHNDYLKRVLKAISSPKLPDDEFDKLSKPAQDWQMAAAPLMKAGKPLPMPAGNAPEADTVETVKDKPAAKAKAAKAAPEPEPEPETESDEGGDATEGEEDGGVVAGEEDAGEEDAGDEGGETDGDAEVDDKGEAVTDEEGGDAEQTKKGRGGAKKAKKDKPKKNLLTFSVVDMRREVVRNPKITVAELLEISKKHDPAGEVKKSTITIARATTLTVIKLMREEGRWKE